LAQQEKQTVEYFPHYCSHKKTMFIIEGQYGSDAYVFWFKLLELLGKTAGHAYDCNQGYNWKFLVAWTSSKLSGAGNRLDEAFCAGLLDMLAELDAIDPKLWQNRVIWSENFVQGLKPLYSKRTTGLPAKPTIPARNQRCEAQTGTDTARNVVHVGNPVPEIDKGSKGSKESKEREPVPDSRREEFEEKFWRVYPARNGKKINKEGTYKRYLQKIKKEDREAFFAAVINYKNSELVQAGKGIKDPERFIANRDHPSYWEEWTEPEKKPTQQERFPLEQTPPCRKEFKRD